MNNINPDMDIIDNEYRDNLARRVQHERRGSLVFFICVFVLGILVGFLIGLSPQANATEPSGYGDPLESCIQENRYLKDKVSALTLERDDYKSRYMFQAQAMDELQDTWETTANDNSRLYGLLVLQDREIQQLKSDNTMQSWAIEAKNRKIDRQAALIQQLRTRLRNRR